MDTRALQQAADGTRIQGFAPTEIVLISDGSVDVSTWTAFCFPAVAATYQINGAGNTATIPAGTIRVVGRSVNTITFSGGLSSAVCEVMK